MNKWNKLIALLLAMVLPLGMITTAFATDKATRAAVIEDLYRLAGSPEVTGENPFTDVAEDAAYRNAVVWAYANKIVKGRTETTFDPNAAITRQETATLFYRYAQSSGYDVSVGEDTNILSYNDAMTISEYAIPAFQWGCGVGLFEGDSSANLLPKEQILTAHMNLLIERFAKTTFVVTEAYKDYQTLVSFFETADENGKTNLEKSNAVNMILLRDRSTDPNASVARVPYTNTGFYPTGVVVENGKLIGLGIHILNEDVYPLQSFKVYSRNIDLVGHLDLSECDDMVFLDVYNNRITSIELGTMDSMRILGIQNNKISELDPTGLPVCQGIDAGFNFITSIDLSKNPELVEFYINDNPDFAEIDLSHNAKLKYFYCNNTKVTTLDLTHNPLLRHVKAYGCPMTSIRGFAPQSEDNAVLNLTAGEGGTIGLHYGPVYNAQWKETGEWHQTYYAYPAEGYAFEGWYDADGNLVSTEATWVVTYGDSHDITAKFVESEAYKDYQTLVSFFETADENGKTNLEKSNEVSQILLRDRSTDPNASVARVPYENTSKLYPTGVVVENGKLIGLGIHILNEDVYPLQSFKVYSRNIDLVGHLDLSECDDMVFLDVYNNRITSIELGTMDSMRILGIQNNKISELDPTGLPVCQGIDAGFNFITSIDLSKNPELVEFYINDNPDFAEIDLSHNAKLKYFYCNNTKVTTLDLTHNPLLRHVKAYGCPMTSIRGFAPQSEDNAVLNLTAGEGGTIGLHYGPVYNAQWKETGEWHQTYYAYPAEGYAFEGWYDADGNLVSTEATWVVTYGDSHDITAKFAPQG